MSDSTKLTTNEEIISYGLGRQMGSELARNEIDNLDLSLVKLGLEESFKGVQSGVSEEQFNAAFSDLQATMQERAETNNKAAIEAGQQYLKNNAARSGVKVTDSGLQYEVIVQGEGETPTADSVVRTHYHGTFVNGQVFDSSVQRDEPAEFAVGGVIPAWTEALQMMNAGSKWRLAIPPELAYGAQGAGSSIPAHATLLFEVELLEIL